MNTKSITLLAELKQVNNHSARIDLIESLDIEGVKTAVIVKETGLTDYAVRHYRRLYKKADPIVLVMLKNGSISFSHAKAIASQPIKKQEKMARDIVAKKISVHQLRSKLNGQSDASLNIHLEKLSNQYSEISGLDITIEANKHNPQAGVWKIKYHNLDAFDSIVEKLVGSSPEFD